MQKLCTIIVLNTMLFVANSIGMELQDVGQPRTISKDIMRDFIRSDRQDNAQKFITEHPHIVSAWVDCCNSLDHSYDDSYSVLHCLVEYDEVSLVKALLAEGANKHINKWTGRKWLTPLHMVQSKEMAELLLDHGADLDAKDKDGVTPLGHALFYRGICDFYSRCFLPVVTCSEQDNELRRYLLERGANSKAVDNKGNSLLHRVALGDVFYPPRHYPEFITLLMEFGADIEMKDSDGRTPYDCAIAQGSYAQGILKALEEYNIFFVSDQLPRNICWRKKISWRDEIGEYQNCRAKNLLELLQNDAAEFKRCIRNRPDSCGIVFIKGVLTDVLKMARKNKYRGEIKYYELRGYLFNKVNMADLEEWCGKDSVDYLCQYLKI